MSKIVSAEALRKSLSEERASPEKPRSPAVKAVPSPAGAAAPFSAVGSPLPGGALNGTPQKTVTSTPLKSPQAAAVTPTRSSRK